MCGTSQRMLSISHWKSSLTLKELYPENFSAVIMFSNKRKAPLTESQKIHSEIMIPKLQDIFEEIISYIPAEKQGKIFINGNVLS